ncbi:TatD family hydrolase [Duganella qianjiadongensis]|uniref:TatD family deoxyribonuclease n=1 Tax=Duganella qianjiadongensis TaxID=2692176 RepID=A0ABW9VN31_9BURK|nr:TatD family hydrolase [Duganella qianjiadongensis]MYM39849.1 TatD family deoxyribonuclease [Duganella qianjiadongensis]
MWIDTHCHLDAHEFAGDGVGQAVLAQQQGVGMIVIPAVEAANFSTVAALAGSAANASYALGIHPIYVPHASEDDLLTLRTQVAAAIRDRRFVALGEIGLDFFIPMLNQAPMREKQIHFLREQLKIAREYELPVLLHVRRSQDVVLKHVRQIRPAGGIAHAFNGSMQQALAYIDAGFKLGFGGAMTYTRALQIRRLAVELPLSSIVLETDAPDISPSWIHPGRNSPDQLARIGAELAQLRGIPVLEVAQATTANARAVLPRLPV